MKKGFICLIIMFTQEDLLAALKFFVQTATKLLLSSEEKTKRAMLHISITMSLEVTMIFTIF